VSYRDDHAAAIARIEALEGELEELRTENAELRARLEAPPELDPDSSPLPAPSDGLLTRAFKWIATAAIAVGIVAGLVGAWAGIRSCGAPGGVFRGPAISGQLTATGPTLHGDWVLDPGTCASGQHMQFYGVDIVDKTDPIKILRLVEDPVQGRIVKMNIPGTDQALFIDRASCKVWDWTLEPTNSTYNDIRLLDGHIALDCTFATGGTFTGRIDFKGCR
jgi:hypothetical protein